MKHTLTLLPDGWTVLAMYGGQTETYIVNRYAADESRIVTLRRHDHTESGRPWIPMCLAETGRELARREVAAR